jgi:uncharacterized membrane protein
MACLYVIAGIKHFLNPDFFTGIMPPWLGWHLQLVYISGACEILFGLLLIPVKTRRIGAWCIIGLLIAVFPANIQMMINYFHEHRPGLWLTILRLPLQAVLIWWAYLYTKPVVILNEK